MVTRGVINRQIILVLCSTVCSVFVSHAQAVNSKTSKQELTPECYGHWQKGVFSLTSFEQPDGKYIGPANEMSLAYVFNKDGSAKEYFISNSNTYNCRMQVLGLRKGKLVVNGADNSFEFRPDSGYYTTLSCFAKAPVKKPYASQDLYPVYVAKGQCKIGADGTPELVTLRPDGTPGLVLRKIQ